MLPIALPFTCSLGSHKMKASALGIYAVLSTAARYISSTLLGYVNCLINSTAQSTNYSRLQIG